MILRLPKSFIRSAIPGARSPELAELTKQLITHSHVQSDDSWGLDHGTWSVLLPMYPAADIPVYQLSLAFHESPAYHYEIGKQLTKRAIKVC